MTEEPYLITNRNEPLLRDCLSNNHLEVLYEETAQTATSDSSLVLPQHGHWVHHQRAYWPAHQGYLSAYSNNQQSNTGNPLDAHRTPCGNARIASGSLRFGQLDKEHELRSQHRRMEVPMRDLEVSQCQGINRCVAFKTSIALAVQIQRIFIQDVPVAVVQEGRHEHECPVEEFFFSHS